jgi:hypothetical protein
MHILKAVTYLDGIDSLHAFAKLAEMLPLDVLKYLETRRSSQFVCESAC